MRPPTLARPTEAELDALRARLDCHPAPPNCPTCDGSGVLVPDDDEPRDTDDDTAEIDIPVFLPEDDGAADLLSLAEHEARIAAAVRRVYPTADYNPHRGLIRVPADPDAARRVVPELAGCRLLQTVGGGVGCWFELTPAA